jgi:signal transduction histidine kinase
MTTLPVADLSADPPADTAAAHELADAEPRQFSFRSHVFALMLASLSTAVGLAVLVVAALARPYDGAATPRVSVGLVALACILGAAAMIERRLSSNMRALAAAARALARREPLPAMRTSVREITEIVRALDEVRAEFNDSAERLRACEQREQDLERQSLHTQRLEALGTLAGGIAHDLNNTLVPVLGLAKLTMKRLPEASREHANLAMIVSAGERARDLVRRILAYSRKEAPARQAVDIAALVRDSLKMLCASLPSTIHFEQQIDDVPLVSGDPGQLHQIMINLVVNAAQAIGSNMGTVSVTLVNGPEQNLDGDVHASPTPMVRLSVSDTGCGMDEAVVRRIFEPFFTTKPIGEGTGLRLSVVHGIVTQHGGHITVDSRIEQGTRFDIYLPALSREQEAKTLAAAGVAL